LPVYFDFDVFNFHVPASLWAYSMVGPTRKDATATNVMVDFIVIPPIATCSLYGLVACESNLCPVTGAGRELRASASLHPVGAECNGGVGGAAWSGHERWRGSP